MPSFGGGCCLGGNCGVTMLQNVAKESLPHAHALDPWRVMPESLLKSITGIEWKKDLPEVTCRGPLEAVGKRRRLARRQTADRMASSASGRQGVRNGQRKQPVRTGSVSTMLLISGPQFRVDSTVKKSFLIVGAWRAAASHSARENGSFRMVSQNPVVWKSSAMVPACWPCRQKAMAEPGRLWPRRIRTPADQDWREPGRGHARVGADRCPGGPRPWA